MAKIEDAVVDFLLNHGTFFASLISQMQRVADPKRTPTIATEVRNGRISLIYNPEFIEGRTMKDTKALLEHECLHLVMEHHARFKDKDPELSGIATDVAINQMLTYCPPDGLTVDNVFEGQAHRNESADYYYNLLAKNQKQKDKAKQNAQGKGCDNDFSESDGNTGLDEELQKETVKQMVKEAVDTAQKNGGQGNLPAGLERYLEELFKPPEVSWRQLLRKFVSNSVKSGHKASWKRGSRRYGDLQKGRIADRTVSLVVAIDTSGSINDQMLTAFIDEIKGIQACYKSDIHVVECDAEVGKYYKLKKYGKVEKKLSGGGGTDFAPVFDYVKKKNIRCDALVYFTDLAGSFPAKKPRYPVLWGYYNAWGGGQGQAPFGTVITLKLDKKGDK